MSTPDPSTTSAQTFSDEHRALTSDASPRLGQVQGLFTRPTDPGLPTVPKQPITAAEIAPGGLAGDVNLYRQRKLNDTPDRALLLYDQETLLTVVQDGWPLKAGDIGENILTSGLPPEIWREGTRLKLGKTLEIQLTEAGVPCSTLQALPYVGRQKGKAFIQALMGRRGWHARVLVPGSLTLGDPIQVL